MRNPRIRSQWIYNMLISGLPEEPAGQPHAALRRHRQKRLKEMVLSNVFESFQPPNPQSMREGYPHV